MYIVNNNAKIISSSEKENMAVDDNNNAYLHVSLFSNVLIKKTLLTLSDNV